MKTPALVLLLFVTGCSVIRPHKNQLTESNQLILNKLIKPLLKEDRQNPARVVYSYRYHNSIVYYVSPKHNGEFSDLYDRNCTLLGHPDGGSKNIGDGLFMDFKTSKSNKRLIWNYTK